MAERNDTQSTWFTRWFLEYNPLYLISAAAVLVGVYFLSTGLAQQDGLAPELWLTALTEVYQLLLIGGAALLYRIGDRRPAVMLGLLAVVYFGDLTFQNRVAAYLGWLGVVASLLWWVLLAAKVALLAWALRLRLSLGARFLPLAGALGLAVLPHLLERKLLPPHVAEQVIAVFVFALGATGAWTRRRLDSRDQLSTWGRMVLRRATAATWLLWGGLVLVHVALWSIDHQLHPFALLVSVGLLLATRWVADELRAALMLALAMGTMVLFQPDSLWLIALSASATAALRSYRRLTRLGVEPVVATQPHPYRLPSMPSTAVSTPPARWALRPPDVAERGRWLLVSLCCVYLGVWTLRWSGAAWLPHLLWLDLALTGLAMLLFFRRRVRLAALPVLLVHGHHVVQSGLMPAHGNAVGWGALILGLGFVLLLVGLAINWFGRRRLPPAEGE